jgi:hypothetical protein
MHCTPKPAAVPDYRQGKAMLPIIIDVEASGFGRDSYPIEIGLVLPDGTPHCFLIHPERAWTAWDAEAEVVHGISRDTLLRIGRPALDVAWRLNGLLRGKTVYSDAWSFDLSWIGKLYEAVHQVQEFRIAALRELLNERELAAWDQTRQQVSRELDLQRHRASGDARVLRETLARVWSLAA